MNRSITSVKQAEEFFHGLVPNARSYAADGLTLRRMWPLLAAVGNPHLHVKALHVAGTSGKTSTAYYAAALLNASGQKVMLTVSPHLSDMRERLQIDGEVINEEMFCSYLSEFLGKIDIDASKPSYFELLMVFVLWVCVKEKIDYVVLETGLGGLLDSTNVVRREDKVCLLTDIGLDHTEILGETLEEIAAQKAGILHKGNIALTHRQPDQVLTLFREYAESVGAHLTVLENEVIAKNSHLESFQNRNYTLAMEACRYIAERDKFDLKTIDPARIKVPGRMEILKTPHGELILDGAHNEQKMQAFSKSLQLQHPDEKVHFLLAMKKGKDISAVMRLLKPRCASMTVTLFSGLQDAPFTAYPPESLATAARNAGITDVEAVEDSLKALEIFLNKDGIKVITGSLYLIANLRQNIIERIS